MTLRTVGFNLLQLPAAIPDLPNRHRPVEFHRLIRPRKRIEHTPYMRMPDTQVEIEVVLPVSYSNGLLRSLVGCCSRRLRNTLLRSAAKNTQRNKQAETLPTLA